MEVDFRVFFENNFQDFLFVDVANVENDVVEGLARLLENGEARIGLQELFQFVC